MLLLFRATENDHLLRFCVNFVGIGFQSHPCKENAVAALSSAIGASVPLYRSYCVCAYVWSNICLKNQFAGSVKYLQFCRKYAVCLVVFQNYFGTFGERIGVILQFHLLSAFGRLDDESYFCFRREIKDIPDSYTQSMSSFRELGEWETYDAF